MAIYFEDNFNDIFGGTGVVFKKATQSLGATAATTTAAATPKVLSLYSDGIGIYAGNGTPNAVVTAPKGSLFINTGGSSVSTRLYVNTDGATTWTAVTTVA